MDGNNCVFLYFKTIKSIKRSSEQKAKKPTAVEKSLNSVRNTIIGN